MKNIAICCDGTGNEFGRNSANVAETYVALDALRQRSHSEENAP